MPFACQILRGTAGNGGTGAKRDQDSSTTLPQVGAATAVKEPELPKLRTLAIGTDRPCVLALVDDTPQ